MMDEDFVVTSLDVPYTEFSQRCMSATFCGGPGNAWVLNGGKMRFGADSGGFAILIQGPDAMGIPSRRHMGPDARSDGFAGDDHIVHRSVGVDAQATVVKIEIHLPG